MDNISLDSTFEDIIKELDEKNLLYLTSGKIKQIKNNILQKLYLSREELLDFHKKLKDYKFIDELDEIKIGGYIRWINLINKDNIKLTNGGLIIDLKNSDDDIIIICKNSTNRVFSLKMNNCFIFQKLNQQEKILIKIIDYVHK